MESEKTTEHVEWERRLSVLAAQVDVWQQRAQDQPPRIVQGSSLAGDQRDMEPVNLGQLAWYSIVVSVEHLNYFFEGVRRDRTLFPSVQMTILRTAHLSSSKAVWLLSDKSRSIRQARAAEVYGDDLREQLAMVNTTYLPDGHAEAMAEKFKRTLIERQENLQVILDRTASRQRAKHCRVNNTEIVIAAGKIVHSDNSDAQGGVSLLWRTGSAAAHGNISFANSRIKPATTYNGDDGQSYGHLFGSLEQDIGPCAAAAAMSTSAAIELFDSRRKNCLG